MSSKIDFVVPWVDGSDPLWLKEFHKYKGTEPGEDSRKNRYRDWDIFEYWFRAVEVYAPWVNKIHFITWGHIPDWLNTSHPKINVVRHEDYIPHKYLPTFSANPIELNIHRIEGIAEQFVYFNDDMFLTKPLKEEDYFRNGLPCDVAISNASSGGAIASIIMNSITLINKRFSKYSVMKKYPLKWFNLKYGSKLIRNFLLLPWPNFTGFYGAHQPQPFLKLTYDTIWQEYPEEMGATSLNKFRTLADYNQYLFRYWQIVTGQFAVLNRKGHLFRCTEEELASIEQAFSQKKYHTVCLNDMDQTSKDFEGMKEKLQQILNKTFPHKSSFEK